MIKVIVADMDGTLLKGHGSSIFDITHANQEAINQCKKQGVKFMIATGRGYHYGKKMLELYYDNEDVVVCGLNGCIYYDHGNTTDSYLIDVTDAKAMCELVSQYPDCYYNFQLQTTGEERYYYELDNDICLHYNSECEKLGIGKKCDINIETAFNLNKLADIGKLSIRIKNEAACDQLEKIMKERFGQRYEVNRSSSKFLEVNHKLATKGNFIKYLKSKYNLSADEIAVCGDSHNDNSMLNEVSFRFCMKSGDDLTKSIANYLVDDVAECISICLDKNNDKKSK